MIRPEDLEKATNDLEESLKMTVLFSNLLPTVKNIKDIKDHDLKSFDNSLTMMEDSLDKMQNFIDINRQYIEETRMMLDFAQMVAPLIQKQKEEDDDEDEERD